MIFRLQSWNLDWAEMSVDIHGSGRNLNLSLADDLKAGDRDNCLAGVCTNKTLDKWSVDVQTKQYHR